MLETAKQIFDRGYEQLVNTRHEWIPTNGEQDMETVNHIYRVIVQNHDTAKFIDEFHALVDIQHEDGGWGNSSTEQTSHPRVTAFSTQMLLRANNDLPERIERFDEAIHKALSYLASQQREDGTWYDETWGLYDAVSVNTGTFMFARMLKNLPKKTQLLVEEPYQKGLAFIIRTQAEHGGWDYPERYETPVCVTAHLLQKTLSYGEIGLAASQRAIDFLIQAQHPDGHYDKQNIDHTCDTVRALMLASELLQDFRAHDTILKGMRWLLDVRNEDDGYGDYAGDESNVLITCDGLDTMLKYIRYEKVYQKSTSMIG